MDLVRHVAASIQQSLIIASFEDGCVPSDVVERPGVIALALPAFHTEIISPVSPGFPAVSPPALPAVYPISSEREERRQLIRLKSFQLDGLVRVFVDT